MQYGAHEALYLKRRRPYGEGKAIGVGYVPLPSAEDWFEPGSGHVGFCGGQSGAGAGFLRVLRFLLSIFIPPIVPKIILIYHLGFVQQARSGHST
jgi:hypothetical protein